MDEQEVLRKLGFESEAELLSVKQLAKYHPIYATDYFDLSIDEKETNDSIDRLSVDKTFLPIFYYSVYGRIMISGWRALLNTDYKNKVISINTKVVLELKLLLLKKQRTVTIRNLQILMLSLNMYLFLIAITQNQILPQCYLPIIRL